MQVFLQPAENSKQNFPQPYNPNMFMPSQNSFNDSKFAFLKSAHQPISKILKTPTFGIISGIYKKYFDEYTNPYFSGEKCSQIKLRKRSRISIQNMKPDRQSSPDIISESEKMSFQGTHLTQEQNLQTDDEKYFFLLKTIFETQKLTTAQSIQLFKSCPGDFNVLLKRKFLIGDQNSLLIFKLKKLKKRNEEMNKLVIKKAMKSMMNSHKQEKLNQQHTDNILGTER